MASESIDTQRGWQAVKVINYDCIRKRLTKDCEYLNLAYSEYLRCARRANALHRRSLILQRDLLGVLYLHLLSALHTIGCCHGTLLLVQISPIGTARMRLCQWALGPDKPPLLEK